MLYRLSPHKLLISTLPRRTLFSTATAHRFHRAYKSTMAAIASDADIVSRLEKLSIDKPEIVQHDAVKGGQEWRDALEGKGKGEVKVTKTVSLRCLCRVVEGRGI